MSTHTTAGERDEHGFYAELTSSLGRLRQVPLAEYLNPSAEQNDPRFHGTLVHLSVIGLRAVAGFCVSASVLWATLGAWLIPDSLSSVGGLAVVLVFVFGMVSLGLSFWRAAQPRSRVLGLVVLAVLPALDLLGSTSVNITSGERWAFLAATIILMMLVAIATLPLRPLQMTAFGALGAVLYGAAVVKSGSDLSNGGAATIGLVFVLMTLILCTGLTAIVYHQRLLTYRARKAAQEAFEELRDAQVRVSVSENAASQSRFAAALSHELNTPLGTLTSAFDTLVHAHERERTDPDARSKLQSVWTDAIRSGEQSAKRLRQTVERMKRLTNLDRAEEQTVDLNELIRDTVALLSGELERKAKFELDLASLEPLRCRPAQIGAVFSNLLRNAAAAMDKDEPGFIRVSSRQSDDEWIVEIQDNGRGMSERQLKDLFNPTFRVEGSRVATTNWGLFVSRSIVTEHGGVLEIESEEGVGTTAKVVLRS